MKVWTARFVAAAQEKVPEKTAIIWHPTRRRCGMPQDFISTCGRTATPLASSSLTAHRHAPVRLSAAKPASVCRRLRINFWGGPGISHTATAFLAARKAFAREQSDFVCDAVIAVDGSINPAGAYSVADREHCNPSPNRNGISKFAPFGWRTVDTGGTGLITVTGARRGNECSRS